MARFIPTPTVPEISDDVLHYIEKAGRKVTRIPAKEHGFYYGHVIEVEYKLTSGATTRGALIFVPAGMPNLAGRIDLG